MKTRYSPQTKQEVLQLGKVGKTYTEIRTIYPIPKSTLSYWFKNAGTVRDRARQLEHLKHARDRALETIHRNKQERLTKAASRAEADLINLPLSNLSTLKGLLAMLYWAEGSKGDNGALIFVNTDPVLALLYLRLLRATFVLDESKLRIRLHIHYYHRHKTVKAFWSELLQVPESQFGKIYVKKRSTRKRFRKNFQGICSIVYHDSSVRRELLALGLLIAKKL